VCSSKSSPVDGKGELTPLKSPSSRGGGEEQKTKRHGRGGAPTSGDRADRNRFAVKNGDGMERVS